MTEDGGIKAITDDWQIQGDDALPAGDDAAQKQSEQKSGK